MQAVHFTKGTNEYSDFEWGVISELSTFAKSILNGYGISAVSYKGIEFHINNALLHQYLFPHVVLAAHKLAAVEGVLDLMMVDTVDIPNHEYEARETLLPYTLSILRPASEKRYLETMRLIGEAMLMAVTRFRKEHSFSGVMPASYIYKPPT